MDVSLFSQSLFALPLDAAIEATASIGYPAIELACCAPHFDARTAHNKADAVARRVAEAGLEVSALSLFNSFTNRGTLNDEVEAAEAYIRLAPLFETRVVKLTPGPPGWRDAGTEHWDSLAEAVDRLMPIADEVGVQLAFETHMRQLTDSVASSVRLLAMAPTSTLGLTVDFSNLVFAGEDMSEAVAMLGGRMLNTHLKNGYIDDDGGWQFRALDEGWTDYAKVLNLLLDIEYPGYLTVECLGPESAERPVERAAGDLDVLMTWLAKIEGDYDEEEEEDSSD